ncbi:unnamed protein product [Rotaria magnacalcarata]|uniref:Uncharacterized protein n=1 Tax=Rotaria magnacalcarata TaxID=392030 RepID=A0A816UB14_9BILA|nr:unnamed protein product [Rotaria magnacalcarata]
MLRQDSLHSQGRQICVLLFALPVLSFIRRLPACNPEVGDPIIVHCLAVVDTVLNKICEHLSLSMPSFLRYIRQQRNRVTDFQLSFEQIYENLSKNSTQAILLYDPC